MTLVESQLALAALASLCAGRRGEGAQRRGPFSFTQLSACGQHTTPTILPVPAWPGFGA
jgi:hypothetical protein